MDAVIEIKLYGGSKHLATLRKSHEVPAGLYSDRPLDTQVRLTPEINVSLNLQIDNVTFNNDCYNLVSNKPVQVEEVLITLGIDNFSSFVTSIRNNGWSVEQYIDNINKYLQLDFNSEPLSIYSRFVDKTISVLLFIALSATPALVLSFTDYSIKTYPFRDFIIFIAITAVIFYTLFGIKRRTKHYKTVKA